jgi:serine/threonine protein kinase
LSKPEGAEKIEETELSICLQDHPTLIVKTYELDHPNMADRYKQYFYRQVVQEFNFCRKAQKEGCFTEVLGFESKKKYSLSEFPILRLFMKDYKEGDLKSWRDKISKDNLKIPIERIEQMVKDMMRAVDILGSKYGLVHRDAKTDNFFMDGDKVVLADFENAIPATRDGIREEVDWKVHLDVTGSLYFRPDDLSEYYSAVEWDVYSLGLSIFFLVAGYLGYDNTDSLHPFAKGVSQGTVTIPDGCPEWLQAVIRKCLSSKEERVAWWSQWRSRVNAGDREEDIVKMSETTKDKVIESSK